MKLTKLSENLYSLRKKRGLSQEEFAEKIHISRQAVSKWERGEAYPDTENLIEIAAFYGVTLDELVNGTDPCGGCACERVTDKDGREDISDEDTAISTVARDYDDATTDVGDDADDEESDGIAPRGKLSFNWQCLLYPIIVTAAYLTLGFLTPRGWEIWWTLFVTIPVYYSVVECVRARRLSPFAYPVFVTFVYLFVGVLLGIWHPTWIVFVTIPVFYGITEAFERRCKGE